MKILETVRNDFLVLGLNPNPSNRMCPFNARNGIRLVMLAYGMIAQTIYLCAIASGFREYTDCIFGLTAIVGAGTVFAMMMFKSWQFFDFFDDMEEAVNGSK